MKVGFIFECGRGGADGQVGQYFADRLKPQIEIDSRYIDNKQNLLENCGPVAALLVKNCDSVVILWDLYPAWRERGIKPCRKDDRLKIFSSLKTNNVPLQKVALVCIEEELEAWLLADIRAVNSVIAACKHPHPVGKLPNYKEPEKIKAPKTRLTRIFNQELGAYRRYVDYQDAIRIARAIPDFTKMRRSCTFRRFVEKATGVKL
ncbi:MAG: DUF4276 family protein [Syntrophales bacterium]|nr:DUF4276 family protein [Syntrophales bacterium]